MADEEAKAERAKEFRTNLTRADRGSRKRYSIAAPSYAAFKQGRESDDGTSESLLSQSTTSHVNPFTSSTGTPSVQGIPLESFGTNLIYREVDELQSLSKIRNFCHDLFPQPLRNALLPPLTRAQWKKFFFIHIPILHWLWEYRPRQLIGDIIAGITIGVTHVPQGIGFALLALLPPVFGLYSSFMPVLLYSFLGTSRHISVGTFPVVALMTGNAIRRITHDLDVCSDGMMLDQNETDPCAYSECDQAKISIAITLSLMVGIIMIIMSLLKLGFITLFLSDALVSGYTAAAAYTIAITQVRFLFGLPNANITSSILTTPRRIVMFSEFIFTGQLTWAAVVTSVLCIIVLLSVDVVNSILRKKVKKIPVHIPAQLIVVILATGISYAANLSERFSLPIINDLGGIQPGQCFGVTLPDISLAHEIVTDAIIISIIGFVINISQAKLLAKKNAYNVHPDQEFLAYGVMNLGGSFFGSFPTAGALSRTVLQDATGGQTQLVGFISSGIVILVILFLGPLFTSLPNAALAAIVVVALKGLYLQATDVYKYFKISKIDMTVWIVVYFSTLCIGLDIGLGIGVLYQILIVIYQTVIPFSPEIGETRAWHYPPDQLIGEEFDEVELKVFRVPNIFIFQFNSPLYFANVSVFRSKISIETGINLEDLRPKMAQGCIQFGCSKMCSLSKKSHTSSHRSTSPATDPLIPEDPRAYSNFDTASTYSGDSNTTVENQIFSDSISEDEMGVAYHTIVIDCAPIGFADSMGVAMIEQIVREYDSIGIQVLLAAPTTPLCKALSRQLFFKRYSSERLFPTIATAVSYAKDGNRVPQLELPAKPNTALASNLERQLLYTARPTFFDDKPVIELEHRGRTITVTEPPVTETESTV